TRRCRPDRRRAPPLRARQGPAYCVRARRRTYNPIMLRLAAPAVQVERRNGNIYLRSPQKLAPYARCVTEWLVQWSDKAPERTFLAERKGEGWRKLSYRETYGAVRRIAQGLLDLKLGPQRPVAILSDNSIDHALLALG